MMNMLGKLFRFALLLIVLAILFFACRLAALALDWPARSGWVLFVAVIAACILFRFGLHRFRRFREERRAAALLAADRAAREGGRSDPELAARMRQTWKSGLDFLGGSRLGRFKSIYALPWYISIVPGNASSRQTADVVAAAAVPGTGPVDGGADPEFNWVFGRKAVWLDTGMPADPDSDERWPLFLSGLVANRGAAPLGGIVVTLETRDFVTLDGGEIQRRATALRSMLNRLIRVTGARIPVYILVNGIDKLYGMRTLVQSLPEAALDSPFGAFRNDEHEAPGEFARRALERSVASLAASAHAARRGVWHAAPGGRGVPPGEAAAFQATDEFMRIGPQLAQFCREAFSDNPYQMVPFLRGVFFGSSGPTGDTLPPLTASLAGFRAETETPAPNRAWFWQGLIDDVIPDDPAPVRAVRQQRHARAVTVHAGLACLMLGTAVICWLLTHSFGLNRNLLRSLRGSVAAPASKEAVQPYLEHILRADQERHSWWLPKMGLHEGDMVIGEMKRRYCTAYADLEILPELTRVGDSVDRIGEWGDPGEIGNTLLYVTVMRRGLDWRDGGRRSASRERLLESLVNILHLATPRERARLQAYLQWSGPDHWLVDKETVVEVERHIIDSAMGGDIMRWLPGWVGSTPGLNSVNTALAWSPLTLSPQDSQGRVVDGAWTLAGYKRAENLLGAVVYDEANPKQWEDRCARILQAYRSQAKYAWLGAANVVWRDAQNAITDDLVPVFIRQAADGDDPAVRILRLLGRHLLPMYPATNDVTDDDDQDEHDPDIKWIDGSLKLLDVASLAAKAPMLDDDQQPGFFTSVRDKVAGVAARIDSDAGMRLLTRNLGLGGGGSSAEALALWERLFKDFSAIATLTASRESCLAAVRQQFLLDGNPGVSAASLAQSAAGDGIAAKAAADPFGSAKKESEELIAILQGMTGSAAWNRISPRASYEFIRYLAIRRAAAYLDTLWRETVYNPALMLTGVDDDSLARLVGQGGLVDGFMTGPAQGFWRREGGRMVNSSWGGIPFRLSKRFLGYCDWIVRRGGVKTPEKIGLGFRIDAVSVNREARERPYNVLFTLTEGDKQQKLAYQNYYVSTTFEWNMDRAASVAVRLEFPSLTLTKGFVGDGALGEFVKAFGQYGLCLTPKDFPAEADAMRRLGITAIAVKATMQNRDTLLRFMDEKYPELPESVVVGAQAAQTAKADGDAANGNGKQSMFVTGGEDKP